MAQTRLAPFRHTKGDRYTEGFHSILRYPFSYKTVLPCEFFVREQRSKNT